MESAKAKLINLLNDTAGLVRTLENELGDELFGKYFGKKRHGVIGEIRVVSVVAKVDHWGGLSFILEIYYTPTYLMNIAKDAEEVIRIGIDEISDFVVMQDLNALELLLEVAD